jgi:excisionase family DNA binding protein
MSSPPGNGRQPEPVPDDDDPLWTPAEVAAYIGGNVTARTVVRCWRAWGLTAYRIGRELRFKRSDVRAMITAHKVPPPADGHPTAGEDDEPRRRRT